MILLCYPTEVAKQLISQEAKLIPPYPRSQSQVLSNVLSDKEMVTADRKVSTSSVSSTVSSVSVSTLSSPTVKLEWEPVVPLGPKAAFHVGGMVEGALFIHGGISDSGSNQPSNQFYRLDPMTTIWKQIRTRGSPALSHHAVVVLENRYFMLIGGWDGRRRTPELHFYDTQEDKWDKLKHSGFPEGAGLSSHTACLLCSGDIIVIGREGSLRTQRRHGNVYILSGSILRGAFTYSEYSREVTSRSGHTANIIGNHIFIVGGRSDSLLEKAEGFKGHQQYPCSLLSKILTTMEERCQAPMTKLPCGRKNHISASDTKCILVHGGETFDGRSREPVGEMFLISLKTPTAFYKLNCTSVGRAGHICFVLPDRVLFHGGLSGKSVIHSDLYELKLLP